MSGVSDGSFSLTSFSPAQLLKLIKMDLDLLHCDEVEINLWPIRKDQSACFFLEIDLHSGGISVKAIKCNTVGFLTTATS